MRLPYVSPLSKADIAQRIAEIRNVAARRPFEPDWAVITNMFKLPQWYQDAKSGLFIHWGVYSVPAFGNEWYPRNMYVAGSAKLEHHLRSLRESKPALVQRSCPNVKS